MGRKLAIIHTTVVTVAPLKQLAAEYLPGYEVVNFVDDSILPQLGGNGGDLRAVEERLVQYARFAEQVGAHAILNACSSVGEVVATMRQHVSIPIVRIDEAMAEAAVQRGSQVGVAATLSTTLRPTLDLLRDKARAAGKTVELRPLLAEDAYGKLVAGDQAGHDDLLAQALAELAPSVDVVVLAQASMARVVPRLPRAIQSTFLSGPKLGMQRVRQVLHEEQTA